MLNVGIIGAGLIGGKRAKSILECGDKLVAVSDKHRTRAEALSGGTAKVYGDWTSLVRDPDVDTVIVATSNDGIVEMARAALEAGKHVLVEKPAGRNPTEIDLLQKTAAMSTRILRVGFNHRFHPGLQKAKQLIHSFGPLMYIRARYGHGGRIGYDREWRADPEVAGGGELLDQGVHLIDLARWLGGEFELAYGHVGTFFWEMPVEDNGFLCLKSEDGKRTAWLHASCTEWKNLFDFEIFTCNAKLQVWGLGRSYGTEELRVFKMKPEMGPPEIEVFTFSGEDKSWNEEWNAFHREIRGEKSDLGTIYDAWKAVSIVYGAYKNSKCGWV